MSKIIHRITNILTIIAMIACVIFDVVILSMASKSMGANIGGLSQQTFMTIFGIILIGFHTGIFTIVLVVKNKIYKKKLAKKQAKELQGAKA